MESHGGSDGSSSNASSSSPSSRDITTSCKLHNATSFTNKELQEMTNNFSEKQAIGEGAFGKVYLGRTLDNGEEIAVKLLHNRPETDDGQFQRELENLMRFEHRNIVRLVGYCYETQHKPMEYMGKACFAEEISKALCFEYMQKGSLGKHLSDENDGLDWHTRYEIIKGTCEGLKYLHEGSIYHLDLKPDNILLDENMVPKLADFGLSRIFDGQQTMVMKSTLGTIGYLPPEYIYGNIVSEKFDIFSLGVVMIKIIAGPKGQTRSAEITSQEFFDQVQANWRNRSQATLSTTPEQLEAQWEQVSRCTEIALNCMEMDRHKRPSIVEIIHKLNKTKYVIDQLVSHSEMPAHLVTLKALAEREAIPSHKRCDGFPVLVQVGVPWRQAEGVDIVVMLDDNNSFWWRPAILVIITKLGPNDRLSIVSLEDYTTRTMDLTYMSNQGREAASLKINELVEAEHAKRSGRLPVSKSTDANASTTVVCLRDGAEILREREMEEGVNRASCIIVLSDGTMRAAIGSGFPVHIFHLTETGVESETMKKIADETSGSYSFFGYQRYREMNDALELFMTSLTKVPAMSVKITIKAHEGISISSIASGIYSNRVRDDYQRSGEIDIDEIYHGERKNFIVRLIVPEWKKQLVTVSGRYQSLDGSNKQLPDTEVFVLRPRLDRCSPAKLAIHPEVAAEFLRIELWDKLQSIPRMYHLTGGGLIQLRKWVSSRSNVPEEIRSEFVKDMDEIIAEYHGRTPRVTYVTAWLCCHQLQRPTIMGTRSMSGDYFTLPRTGCRWSERSMTTKEERACLSTSRLKSFYVCYNFVI